MNTLTQKRSPDAAQRNPGTPAKAGTPAVNARHRMTQKPLGLGTPIPDSAALHPGYARPTPHAPVAARRVGGLPAHQTAGPGTRPGGPVA